MIKVILCGLLVVAVALVSGCSCGGGDALQGIQQNLTALQDQLSQIQNSSDNLEQQLIALEEAGVSPVPDTKYYLGFIPAKAGQWAEYVVVTPTSNIARHECIGEEEVDGKACLGFEVTEEYKTFDEVLLQLWMDVDTAEVVKGVVEISGMPGIYCLAPDQIETLLPMDSWPQLGGYKTPLELRPELGYTLAKFPEDVYPSNTVFEGELDIAVFAVENGSMTCVSSELPFGFVYRKNTAGQIIDHIGSYGFTGAERSITAEQRDTCKVLPAETLQ
jgi:hypothetical protein